MNQAKVRFWSKPKFVSLTPIVTTLLLEAANVQQIWRMWVQRTAAGQSLTGWLCVNVALILWFNFYRVFTPKERFARWGTGVGILLNSAVIFSVLYFRYVV